MFLKNHVTKFNLDLVPETLKRGWELEHGGGHITLEVLQDSSRKWKSLWWFGVVICIAFFITLFDLIGFPAKYPSFSTGWWLVVLPLIIAGSFVLFLLILHVLPSPKFGLVEDFIREYKELMKLLNHEWEYQFRYPTGGPGVRADFKEVESFVREKLVKLAARIKELEEREVNWSDCIVDLSDPKELRKEFGHVFDILKPFGLVYPTYHPYFDPEGSYFYG